MSHLPVNSILYFFSSFAHAHSDATPSHLTIVKPHLPENLKIALFDADDGSVLLNSIDQQVWFNIQQALTPLMLLATQRVKFEMQRSKIQRFYSDLVTRVAILENRVENAQQLLAMEKQSYDIVIKMEDYMKKLAKLKTEPVPLPPIDRRATLTSSQKHSSMPSIPSPPSYPRYPDQPSRQHQEHPTYYQSQQNERRYVVPVECRDRVPYTQQPIEHAPKTAPISRKRTFGSDEYPVPRPVGQPKMRHNVEMPYDDGVRMNNVNYNNDLHSSSPSAFKKHRSDSNAN